MGVHKTNYHFREERVKQTEILKDKELRIIELYLSGLTKMNSYLTVYPKKSALSNSALLNEVERLFSLPRVQKIVRENQH